MEGFHPRNLPERVAYQKLIEELLDKIIERGFLTLGDLRDACSRSNLKIPDLAGPLEFVRGDRLLRTDSALAEELDGVYRRGEIYLRLLQRFSSLAFASPWGRFLTLYVALPFGGAFVGLEGLKHLVQHGQRGRGGFRATPDPRSRRHCGARPDQLPRLPPPVRGRPARDRPGAPRGPV